jgi:hypothetical protein
MSETTSSRHDCISSSPVEDWFMPSRAWTADENQIESGMVPFPFYGAREGGGAAATGVAVRRPR